MTLKFALLLLALCDSFVRSHATPDNTAQAPIDKTAQPVPYAESATSSSDYKLANTSQRAFLAPNDPARVVAGHHQEVASPMGSPVGIVVMVLLVW